MGKLDGKAAIITGGSKGIGQGIAKTFASEGAAVVITARGKADIDKTVEEIRQNGGKAMGIVADQKSHESCKEVFRTVLEEYGRIDIVVANAGTGDLTSIDNITPEHWKDIMDLNLNGVFYYNYEAVQHFMKKMEGVIINVSSTNGIRPLGGVAYSSSQFAVNGMTQNIALRFAGTGIRCNCICPGLTRTPMFDLFLSGGFEAPVETVFTMQEVINTKGGWSIPPEHMNSVNDMANAALYLATAEHVSGVVMTVDNTSWL